jgi:hypothetical protein
MPPNITTFFVTPGVALKTMPMKVDGVDAIAGIAHPNPVALALGRSVFGAEPARSGESMSVLI